MFLLKSWGWVWELVRCNSAADEFVRRSFFEHQSTLYPCYSCSGFCFLIRILGQLRSRAIGEFARATDSEGRQLPGVCARELRHRVLFLGHGQSCLRAEQ